MAVAYYDDVGVQGTALGYQTMELRAIKPEDLAGFLVQIRDHPIVHGGDVPERLFEGLAHAIEEARWNDKSDAPKVVILIGDHGDLPQRTDTNRISRALKGHGHPIQFHVYQVVDPDQPPRVEAAYRKAYETAATEFRSQAMAITKLMGGPPASSYTVVKKGGADLGTDLDKKFAELKAREKELQGRLGGLSARDFPAKVSGEMENILREREVSLEELRTFDGLRVGHEGYLWLRQPGLGAKSDDPAPKQVRVEVLLSLAEIRRLIAAIGPLPVNGTAVLAALKARLDGRVDRSFEEVVLRPLGLPAHSALLTQPLGRIAPGRVAALAAEVRGRCDRLSALLSDPSQRTARFFLTRDGRVEWTWIDVEEELP